MVIIAGVDEAGRGPLAGPVVAAAVILPNSYNLEGLDDSKKVTPKKRSQLFVEIQHQATAIGVGVVAAADIDKTNILQATQQAMKMALGRLKPRPDQAVIDGYALPTQIIPNKGVIKGDQTVDVIKAASIIAKVTRDNMMEQYDIIFPVYGFKSTRDMEPGNIWTSCDLIKHAQFTARVSSQSPRQCPHYPGCGKKAESDNGENKWRLFI